jgi:hypothetical protein
VAARRTQPSWFYPFTGHEYLYFAYGPGVCGEKEMSLQRASGGTGPRDTEFSGSGFYHRLPGPVVCTLTTHDPDKAAA